MPPKQVHPPSGASLDSLPDSLLSRIIVQSACVFVDRPNGVPQVTWEPACKSVALVCRRWHRLLFSEPALWKELGIGCQSLDGLPPEEHAQWFASKRALLRRVGSLVQGLHLNDGRDVVEGADYAWQDGALQQLSDACGAGWQLHADVLAHLGPAALTSLCLRWGPPISQAALQSLSSFASLAVLSLDAQAPMPPNAPAVLAQLSGLHTLRLGDQAAAAEVLACLPQLPALNDLLCRTGDVNTLPAAGALSTLTQLTRLILIERFRPADSSMQPHLQHLLTQLPLLHSWGVGSTHDGDWEGCMEVGNACLHEAAGYRRDPATGAVPELHLNGIRRMPALRQLITAVLPAGVQPSSLRSLSFSRGCLEIDALHGTPQLAHVTRLVLSVCLFHGGSAAAAVEALLQQVPRLQSLTLAGCFPSQPFPDALVSRTGLKQLSLRSNDLSDLPGGPYLQGLEALELRDNKLAHLPPVLAAATSLTRLCLLQNPDLALSDADVDGILLHMPRLAILHLDASRTPAPMVCRLSRAAPQLQVSADIAFV